MAELVFNDKLAENFFLKGDLPKKRVGWFDISRVVSKKLDEMKAVKDIDDLRAIPGHRLKKLENSFYSMRINRRWRFIFRWDEQDQAFMDIEIVDYHN